MFSFQACHDDAKSLCGSSAGWHNTEQDPRHKLVFPCLVRNLYNDEDDEEDDDEDDKKDEDEDSEKLSDVCTEEVERTLRQRATSVQLQPGGNCY